MKTTLSLLLLALATACAPRATEPPQHVRHYCASTSPDSQAYVRCVEAAASEGDDSPRRTNNAAYAVGGAMKQFGDDLRRPPLVCRKVGFQTECR